MNFRKNNGFTGIDITSSMIIILIFIPTIFGTVYNLQMLNFAVDRKAQAVNIVVDELERVKSESFETGRSNSNEQKSVEKDKVRYKVTVTQSYSTEEESVHASLAKKVKVKVEYPIRNKTKSVEISTVIINNIKLE